MISDETKQDPLYSPVHEQVWSKVPTILPLYTEFLIVGGGLSGCAAAISAARMGVKVTLLEPTHMLGGQAGPGGVSAMDETAYYDEIIADFGFWSEFSTRVKRFYTYKLKRRVNVSQYRDDSFAPNPVVVDRVLTQMLKEQGVQTFRNLKISDADVRRGNAAVFTSAGRITGRLVLDATEDGCVIRLAQVPHRLGHAVFNGQQYSAEDFDSTYIQDITQTAMIRRYEQGTMPRELRLTEPPENYSECLEILRAAFPKGPGNSRGDHPNAFAGYRGAPDIGTDNHYTGAQWEKITRTSLNFHNDQMTNASYLLDADARAACERAAINLTLGVIYYLQNECGLDWSVATDEGFDRAPIRRDPRVIEGLPDALVRHLPPIPYIRESVRLVGRRTMTGKSIYRSSNRSCAAFDVTSVATGTYPPDLHGGRRPEDLEEDLEETLVDKPRTWREGPFPIPLGALIPRDKFPIIAAEKNISASRIAAGAVRLHPTVAAVGQAAGVLAALALSHKVHPGDVPTPAVQIMLMRQGAYLPAQRIDDLRKDDDRFVPAQLALLHQVIDEISVRPHDKAPRSRIDVDRAARMGQVIVQEYEDWLIDTALPSA
ncbi:FAD-dependent oxidoreductase [Kocuria marina]|uniref:FAD dependent oxidoreductase n=1 Tax=Kocuria marina subsp. indica TaxID=1049583 RepID=A0A1X7C763_9MICC|nr:FAD-dependent oxidoreductase [Kocuria indica]OXS85944.1 hypothetical protein B1B07_01510 [Kocuria indica]RLP59334.1 FAD-dependent oxidoreductase [Kocuria indica]SME91060.1 FAD dependent oxidoreductase [Kocuria indica]